jgi:hypothetical protein
VSCEAEDDFFCRYSGQESTFTTPQEGKSPTLLVNSKGDGIGGRGPFYRNKSQFDVLAGGVNRWPEEAKSAIIF